MPYGTKIAYKGYTLRSRHELAWARHFDARGYDWRYEAKAWRDPGAPDGVGYTYTPDFELNGGALYVEIKPYGGDLPNKIHYCRAPLLVIFGLPERCYIRLKPAGAAFLGTSRALNWDIAYARV